MIWKCQETGPKWYQIIIYGCCKYQYQWDVIVISYDEKIRDNPSIWPFWDCLAQIWATTFLFKNQAMSLF